MQAICAGTHPRHPPAPQARRPDELFARAGVHSNRPAPARPPPPADLPRRHARPVRPRAAAHPRRSRRRGCSTTCTPSRRCTRRPCGGASKPTTATRSAARRSQGDAPRCRRRSSTRRLATFIGWRDRSRPPPAPAHRRRARVREGPPRRGGRAAAVARVPARGPLARPRPAAREPAAPRSSAAGTTSAPSRATSAGCSGAARTSPPCTAPPSAPGPIPAPDERVELRGRDLLPWAPTRVLSDQEVGDLRQDRRIAAWPSCSPRTGPCRRASPTPAAARPRASTSGRFAFLLRPDEGRLRVLAACPAGCSQDGCSFCSTPLDRPSLRPENPSQFPCFAASMSYV